MKDFYIGLALACTSSFFIGSSFILKKKALRKSSANNQNRAGYGGHQYLREWLWWIGVAIMASGEACNFAAFAFAPASLVTSLGAMSVLVTAVLSSYILKEKLSLLGKIGCALCILGATMIVIHAPRDGSVKTIVELGAKMQSYGFIIYFLVAASAAAFCAFYLAPRYGRTNVFIFIAICSIIGSLTVLACKGLGLAIKEQLGGGYGFVGLLKTPLVWFLLFVVVSCISIQLNYLNKALDIYNISMVTSVYYVGFTSCVIIASGVLYQEWSLLNGKDIIGGLCGFFTTIIGVFQMQFFNDLNISVAQLRKSLYKTGDTPQSPTLDADEAGEIQMHKRRRSFAQMSLSEPLLMNSNSPNGLAAGSGDNNLRSVDTFSIPVHSGKANDANGERDDTRSLSV